VAAALLMQLLTDLIAAARFFATSAIHAADRRMRPITSP
jgi:hypothetical protein